MKAMILKQYGDIDNFHLQEISIPQLKIPEGLHVHARGMYIPRADGKPSKEPRAGGK